MVVNLFFCNTLYYHLLTFVTVHATNHENITASHTTFVMLINYFLVTNLFISSEHTSLPADNAAIEDKKQATRQETSCESPLATCSRFWRLFWL